MPLNSVLSKNLPPLAERIRPQTLSDFCGQKRLVNSKSLLHQSINSNLPFSLIFWGQPGSGKTTLARILSREFVANYFEISAISSGVKDIRNILQKGKDEFENGKCSIMFIDEIHRFTKSQQDSLLHAVEEGSIILIGATTENPSFEIISPLLSRCQILHLNSLNNTELKLILKRALNEDIILGQLNLNLSNNAENLILKSSNGDARKMLNILELSTSLLSENNKQLKRQQIEEAIQQKHLIYDKKSDYHYDVISAFIKSVRGSDPDASIYWLAVMLEGGEKPEFIARRLIILASEDIGNAEPYALQLANAAFDAVHKIGMPESQIVLAQITTYLASVPKSNSSYKAIDACLKMIREKGPESVPVHLRNATNTSMKSEGYEKNYKNVHSYEDHFVKQNYFPDTFNTPIVFYKPQSIGREKYLKERLDKIWSDRYK